PGADDLIQINIEAVDGRYFDKLEVVWGKLKPDAGSVRPRVAGGLKPPEGKGWIIEVRGYTFHDKRSRFLADTLLDRLADPGVPRGGKRVRDRGRVTTRVSHFGLYKTKDAETTADASFTLASASALDTALKGGTGGVPGEGTRPSGNPRERMPDSAGPTGGPR